MTPDLFERHPFRWTGDLADGTAYTISLRACGPECCSGTHVVVRVEYESAREDVAQPVATVEHALGTLVGAAQHWLESGSEAAVTNAGPFLAYAGAWLQRYLREHSPGGGRVH